MSAKNMFYSSEITFSNAEERAYARENLVFNVTEDLLLMLEDLDISKSELAKRLGKSKSYVSQVLSGSRNMTLGSFSDICYALGFKPEIKIPVKELKNDLSSWQVSEKPKLVKKVTHIRDSKNIQEVGSKSLWSNVRLKVAC